jgi:uncharacterized membrane protein
MPLDERSVALSQSLGIALSLHQLASVVWVGGMFFAHFALRPTLKQALEPQARLQVVLGVFRRFFPWVWLSIATLWITGGWVTLAVLQGRVGLHVSAMMAIALVMTLVFVYLFFVPYRRMRHSVEQEVWRSASTAFDRIRQLMAINLTLGILTVVIAVSGPVALARLSAFLGAQP